MKYMNESYLRKITWKIIVHVETTVTFSCYEPCRDCHADQVRAGNAQRWLEAMCGSGVTVGHSDQWLDFETLK